MVLGKPGEQTTQRILITAGRIASAIELEMEYSEEDGYRLKRSPLEETIRRAGKDLTRTDLETMTAMDSSTLRRQLDKLEADGKVVKVGDGTKEMPFTYRYTDKD